MPEAVPSSATIPAARSSAKVGRPIWSSTTVGETPRAASPSIVRTKLAPSPTTQVVRTIRCRAASDAAISPAAFVAP